MIGFAKDYRKGAWFEPGFMEQGNDAAGINAAGEEDPDGNVTDHLHLDGFIECGGNIGL